MIFDQARSFMLFEDFIAKYTREFDPDDWIDIFRNTPYLEGNCDDINVLPAVVSIEQLESALAGTHWTLHNRDMRPTIEIVDPVGHATENYVRFSGEFDSEPLVIVQNYILKIPNTIDILEDFRLFHNLLPNSNHTRYTYIDSIGDEDDAAIIESYSVRVKAKYLLHYLAERNSALLFQFDNRRMSKYTLDKLSIADDGIEIKNGKCTFSINLINGWWGQPSSSTGSSSLMIGKIAMLGKRVGSLSGNYETEKYCEFIIGNDESCLVSCKAGEYSTKGYDYLTPVAFKRSVLQKYYDDPKRYEVDDGVVRGPSFALAIDNDLSDMVCVYIGDLGRDLPYKEQLHWKAHNVAKRPGISPTKWERDFMARPSIPAAADLQFKHQYKIVAGKWQKETGWDLYLPLKHLDKYRLSSVHIPIANNQKEFDEQISAIVILVIDSISVDELRKKTGDMTTNGSISLFESYLNRLGLQVESEKHISLLRDIQSLRSSGSAHRKGDKYDKAAKNFGLTESNYKQVLNIILNRLIEFLDFLINDVLPIAARNS